MAAPDSRQIEVLLLEAARSYFEDKPFTRENMVKSTCRRAQTRGWWLTERNSSETTEAAAAIDSVFSDLVRRGALIRAGKNLWNFAGLTRRAEP